jgi:hypothetical protein
LVRLAEGLSDAQLIAQSVTDRAPSKRYLSVILCDASLRVVSRRVGSSAADDIVAETFLGGVSVVL